MSKDAVTGLLPSGEREIIPAATVVIFRRGQTGAPELLMVQRSRALRFAGGAAVFPGGKVDPADYILAAELYPDEDPDVAAGKIAVVRETIEETGLVIGIREPIRAEDALAARELLITQGALAPVLQAFGWTLQLERLVFFAHWCPRFARAFDTRFFAIDLGTGAVELTVDATENTRLFWSTAAGALEMAERGEISVIFPTRRNLERLALFGDFAELLEDIARHPAARICPEQVERDGETWLQIPDGLGYPVTRQPLSSAIRG